jgi:hypothetical protein
VDRDTLDISGHGIGGVVPTPLITNGDFESYTGTQDDDTSDTIAGWTDVNEGTSLVEATEEVNAGSNAVKLTTGASDTAQIRQTVTVRSSDRFDLWFYTRGDGTNPLYYSVYDATNSADIIALTSSGVTGEDYTVVKATVNVPAACTSIYINFYASATSGHYGYVDDVSLRSGWTIIYNPDVIAGCPFCGSTNYR